MLRVVQRSVEQLVPPGHQLLPGKLVDVDLRDAENRTHHRVEVVHLGPRCRRDHGDQGSSGDVRRDVLDRLPVERIAGVRQKPGNSGFPEQKSSVTLA